MLPGEGRNDFFLGVELPEAEAEAITTFYLSTTLVLILNI